MEINNKREIIINLSMVEIDFRIKIKTNRKNQEDSSIPKQQRIDLEIPKVPHKE